VESLPTFLFIKDSKRQLSFKYNQKALTIFGPAAATAYSKIGSNLHSLREHFVKQHLQSGTVYPNPIPSNISGFTSFTRLLKTKYSNHAYHQWRVFAHTCDSLQLWMTSTCITNHVTISITNTSVLLKMCSCIMHILYHYMNLHYKLSLFSNIY